MRRAFFIPFKRTPLPEAKITYIFYERVNFMDNNYTVYIHKLPNNKIYIGYINMDSPFVQGKTLDEIFDNGRYHEKKGLLYKDICTYDWSQIQTEQISGLTKKQAVEKKQELCLEYESYLPALGYNRYCDAGLQQPPKTKSVDKSRLSHKLISLFLHNDFTINEYVANQLNNCSDEQLKQFTELINTNSGQIALSLTRKKFNTPYAEAAYLLSVLSNPNKHITKDS